MDGVGKDGIKDCGWYLCKKGENGKPRKFIPNPIKKDHEYCCASCRVAAYNFRTAGVKAISQMQKQIADHTNRLEALENIVKNAPK